MSKDLPMAEFDVSDVFSLHWVVFLWVFFFFENKSGIAAFVFHVLWPASFHVLSGLLKINVCVVRKQTPFLLHSQHNQTLKVYKDCKLHQKTRCGMQVPPGGRPAEYRCRPIWMLVSKSQKCRCCGNFGPVLGQKNGAPFSATTRPTCTKRRLWWERDVV